MIKASLFSEAIVVPTLLLGALGLMCVCSPRQPRVRGAQDARQQGGHRRVLWVPVPALHREVSGRSPSPPRGHQRLFLHGEVLYLGKPLTLAPV